MFCLVCACAPHTCHAKGGQKRALDPLELELWAVMHCPRPMLGAKF